MAMPDLDSLRCFEAAAQHLNFRLAAKAVALSPTAFSERIRRLEDDLGRRLFERTTRKVWLTPAGQRLLEKARVCLDAARACEQAVQEDSARLPFALRLGTRFELGLSYIVPNLKALGERVPERKVHVHFGDSPDLLERLMKGEIDAVVSSARLSERRFDYALLHEETYVFCAKTGLVTQSRPLVRPDDAARHTLLDADITLPLFRYFIDAMPREQVWSFGDVESLGTIAAIRYRMLEGAGVGVLPYYFVAQDIKKGRIEVLFDEVELASDWFRLIWRADNPQEGQLRELAEHLRSFPLR